MADLIIEIGTEELPAAYIEPALESLSEQIVRRLTHSRINHGSVRVFGTPRRLAVQVTSVAPRQSASTRQIIGPPERVALDSDGRPTVAVLKFAEKLGLPVSRLKVVDTEKGRYCCADVKQRALATMTLLKEIVPQAIRAVSFPKTMRWADLSMPFARPIHSVMALFGERLVSFTLDNSIRSGRFVFGHHFMQPSKLRIRTAADYMPLLRKAFVIADMEERKAAVLKQVHDIARQLGGSVVPDDELGQIVTNLVEYPVAVSGRFDPAFLELPEEILITAMREHQKFFAVADQQGRLMPCFIAVNNTRASDMKLVAAGHERVLHARLSDARFFYESDVKTPLEKWVAGLKGVMFQADLGAMDEKIMRITAVAEYLSENLAPALKPAVSRAALLCKADLLSQVVVEFPKLQGIMGRIYASRAGESEAVADAIEAHYQPVSAGAELPASDTGAILAIADKIDTLCGFFSIGLPPTGASDPYALRRQGIGIVTILLKKNYSVSLRDLIQFGVAQYSTAVDVDLTEKIYGFFKNRIARLLIEQKLSKDVVAAVVEQSVDIVPQVWPRVRTLEKMKGSADFALLVSTYKRVRNIVRKTSVPMGEAIDEKLFSHPSEAALYNALLSVKERVRMDLADGAYNDALVQLASLRSIVDDFFIGVKVMADEPAQRGNRLALLAGVASLFSEFADFSKINI